MPTQTPTLAEVLDTAMADRLRESFSGWMPARVESYDEATNLASIQVLVYDSYTDEEGERKIEKFPVINDVPVVFLSLGGKFVVRSKVAAGDEGLYMVASRPVNKWVQTGGMVDPEDDGAHDINDGCFLPARLSAGGSNADPMIEITGPEIKIGGGDSLALVSELNDLKAAYETHIHNANGTSLPVTAPGPPPPFSGYPGTQKLKGG